MLRNLLNPFLICLLFLSSAAHAGTLSVVGKTRWVTVTQVFDGDTFRTRTGEKIRLLGINTPEVAHHDQAGQPYGKEAKRRLVSLIAGKSVLLRMDKEKRDKYGRTLAQVFLRNGGWINKQLVAEGLAHVYTFMPNSYWAAALLKAEKRARKEMAGIWKTDAFRILSAKDLGPRHIGQFRLVRGYVKSSQPWQFKLGKLQVSVPRNYRQWFHTSQLPKTGDKVIVRGKVRTSATGQLYLALHSPFDLE